MEDVRLDPKVWYCKAAEQRETLAEEARADAGLCDFSVGDSLRVTWLVAQRADPALAVLLKRTESELAKDGFRKGADGLLEKRVVLKEPLPAAFVAVVPGGFAAANMSWKRWTFLQAHVGVFGGHRGAEKTSDLLSRIAWWEGMRRDIEQWTERCLSCIRMRKRPVKQEAVAVKPVHLQAWEEVMADLEGPSNPPSDGYVYVFTYMCMLCHGVLLEPCTRLTFSEVRRAFARCIFRSGTLPLILRSDRGPEFKNIMMKEFSCLVGFRHRFGTAWRPMEQGAVERVHQECQKILGLLVGDITKSYPHEWAELLPIVEFLLYNTPGPHGLTPRDVDRRWSLALPLEKDRSRCWSSSL